MIQSVRVCAISVPPSALFSFSFGSPKPTYQVAFASRIKCYGQWQNAENDIRRVKSLGEKARRQGRNHAQDIADAERKATLARQEFEKVTRLLKVEMHRFDMERVEDFKKSLEALLEGMIMRQRQVRCSSCLTSGMRTKGCSYMRIFAVDQSVGVVSRAVITKGGDESETRYIAVGRLTR
jgi:hypothetical protein